LNLGIEERRPDLVGAPFLFLGNKQTRWPKGFFRNGDLATIPSQGAGPIEGAPHPKIAGATLGMTTPENIGRKQRKNRPEGRPLQHQGIGDAEKFAGFGRGNAGVGGEAVEVIEAGAWAPGRQGG